MVDTDRIRLKWLALFFKISSIGKEKLLSALLTFSDDPLSANLTFGLPEVDSSYGAVSVSLSPKKNAGYIISFRQSVFDALTAGLIEGEVYNLHIHTNFGDVLGKFFMNGILYSKIRIKDIEIKVGVHREKLPCSASMPIAAFSKIPHIEISGVVPMVVL